MDKTIELDKLVQFKLESYDPELVFLVIPFFIDFVLNFFNIPGI